MVDSFDADDREEVPGVLPLDDTSSEDYAEEEALFIELLEQSQSDAPNGTYENDDDLDSSNKWWASAQQMEEASEVPQGAKFDVPKPSAWKELPSEGNPSSHYHR